MIYKGCDKCQGYKGKQFDPSLSLESRDGITIARVQSNNKITLVGVTRKGLERANLETDLPGEEKCVQKI